MAEYLDLALRAQDSTIRARVLAELQVLYNVESFEPKKIGITIPINGILQDKANATTARVWNNTRWRCTQYPQKTTDRKIKNTLETISDRVLEREKHQ